MTVALHPRVATDATAVVLDGEAVVHRAGQVHTLDPVATLVWHCCDGSASVAEIAADLAVGFDADPATVRDDVDATIAALDELGLLAPDAAPGPDASALRLELLVDPPGSCAACAERTWAHRRAVVVGGRLLAVGTNDARADDAIGAAFAAHLFPEPEVLASEPPFLAVELHARAGAGRQQLDLLLRRDTAVARSRRPDRILRALAAHVASYGDLTGLGLAALRGTVVGRDGRVLLVPEVEEPVRFRRDLAALGVAVADQPAALVDPSSREVVVGAPGLDVDLDAVDALTPADEAGSHDEPEPLAWGRYSLVGFGVGAPATGAAALLAFGPDADDERDHDVTVAAICSLLDGLPSTDAVTPDAIAAQLRAG